MRKFLEKYFQVFSTIFSKIVFDFGVKQLFYTVLAN